MSIAPVTTSNPTTRYRTALNELIGDVPLSAVQVKRPGQASQICAGRVLTLADFITLLGLSTPLLLANLTTTTNLGSGGNLTNKGTVTFGAGIMGATTEAAIFTGSTAQALYIADTGSSDPFRIKTGSWGCWFRTANRGTAQGLIGKIASTLQQLAFELVLDTTNAIRANYGITSTGVAGTAGTDYGTVVGTTDLADNRWHHVVATHDGGALRVYVDGAPEISLAAVSTIFAGSGPFNIGGRGADGSTAALNPHYGRVDEAFVTTGVLSDEQVRLLYAASIPHTAGVIPTRFDLSVRRQRRGGPLAAGDFPTQPKRLHNFTAGALTDAGSAGATLTNNATAVSVAGVDGSAAGAFAFKAASSQYLSAADTGLPATTAARSLGAWFAVAGAIGGTPMGILSWGTAATRLLLYVSSTSGLISFRDPVIPPISSSMSVVDGKFHHAVVTQDAAAVDGLKSKLYLDGVLIASDAGQGSVTLLGANGFRVGRDADTNGNYFNGVLDGAFVCDYALTAAQIAAVYGKGSLALGPSPKDPGAHIEAVDAVNAYAIFDTIEPQHTIDLQVGA